MSGTLRLFVASPLTGQAREALQANYAQRERIAAKMPQRIRWLTPEQWHLTWLFLGSVAGEALPDIQAQLKAGLADMRPMSASLQDIVFWPKPRKPRLIVCRLQPNPKLLRTWEAICKALPNFPPDKPFAPHITLARLKEIPAETPAIRKPGWVFSPISPSDWLLDEVILYRSRLTPDGAIYETLKTLHLHS